MIDETFRVMTLAQILEKIYSDDAAYYKKILKHFKLQTVITDRGNRYMEPRTLARYIITSGNPIADMRHVEYSVRQICYVVSSSIMPMPVKSANSRLQPAVFSRSLNSAIDSCFIFKIKIDSEEYLTVPSEYRFLPRSPMKLPSQFTLNDALLNTAKNRLKEYLDSAEAISHVASMEDVFLRGAVYSLVISEFYRILSKLSPQARKLYDHIINLYGAVSKGEISKIMIENSENEKQNTRGGNASVHYFGAKDPREQLLYNFLLLTVKSGQSGNEIAYIIPDEMMIFIALDKISAVEEVTDISFPERKGEDYSMITGVRNFLIASFYLELQGKRRTSDKLSSILSVSEENLTFLDGFCRHAWYISGSSSTYQVTDSGINAMSDLTNIERDIRKYITSVLDGTRYDFENHETDLMRVEGAVYKVLKSIEGAYSIADLETLIKWNPENIYKFRENLLKGILDSYYWKGEKDASGDVRKKVIDYADRTLLNFAVKHLVELGIITAGHKAGDEGTEVVMVRPEDGSRSLINADSKRLKDYIARNKAKLVVQSNFEIIVSPLEDFNIIKNLLYGCDLVSASTTLVFKMTEKSLRFYANNFADLNGFLGLLKAQSAHPVPENVSRIFRDIAEHAGEVTVRKCAGILVFRDHLLMKRTISVRALSKIKTFEISDTVLGIRNASDFEKIGKVLADAGVLYKLEETANNNEDSEPVRKARRKRRYREDWEDSYE